MRLLIDKAELMRHIENEMREWGEDYDALQILGDIEDFPTVDPVKRGRWEIYDTYKQTIDGRTFDGWCECSECRTMCPRDFSIYNYCPHCGAKMDEERKEDEDN